MPPGDGPLNRFDRVAYHRAATSLRRLSGRRARRASRLLGMIGLFDLLEARLRNLEAERRRDRVLPVRFVLPRALSRRRTGQEEATRDTG
jgi:hypothetical protein